MSEKQETQVPLSVVFITIGVLILIFVGAMWLLVPSTMPQPIYDLVGGYIHPVEPASIAESAIAAPQPTATRPTTQISLLPETQVGEEEIPDYFVSAEEASQRRVGEGEPSRIVIPNINLDVNITQVGLQQVWQNEEVYYQWQVPQSRQAGWHNNSARLGDSGNTVLNGHHNVHGEVFRDLVNLNEGNRIVLYDGQGEQFVYRVTMTEILAERDQPIDVRLQNAQWIEPTDDERLTLVTCWPYTDNSHRVVVVAEPIN